MAYDPIIFNSNPYYDDFSHSAGFLKILFRPGYAIQARELTQAQSILQNQISKIGDHLFRDGSRILGSGISVRTTGTARIAISSLDLVGITDYTQLLGTELTNETVKAKIVAFSPVGSGGNSSHLLTAVNFISGSEFATGGVSFGTSTLTLVESSKTAKTINVSAGIFYVDGFFVPVESQSFIPTRVVGSTLDSQFISNSAPFSDLSTKIGYFIIRDTVTAQEDSTLTDPSIGSYNYNAPGADRYKINLVLGQSGITAESDDFLELLRIENGNITKKIEKITYAEIEKTLARRTYEESGSYVVKPFDVSVKDAGVSLDVCFGSGKAYVFGHELENQYPQNVSIAKARTEKTETDVSFPYSIGNYIGISMSGTSLGITLATNIAESSSASAVVKFKNSTGVVASGYVHGVIPRSTGVSYSRIADIYLYGITGSVVGASYGVLYKHDGGTTLCEFGPVSGTTFGEIQDSNNQSLVYEITPGYAINSITNITVPGKLWVGASLSGGSASGAIFTVDSSNLPVSDTYYDLDTSVAYSDIALMNSSGNIFFPQNATAVLGNQSELSTRTTGKTEFVVNSGLSAGFTSGSVKMLLPVIYKVTGANANNVRIKTATGFTESNITVSDATRVFTENGKGIVVTSLADIFNVTKVIGASGGVTADITDYFELDDGQREAYYDKSRLVVKTSKQTTWNSAVTGYATITITGKHFVHAGLAGAPFAGMTSYIGVSYENIPLFTNTRTGKTVSLANCLDFRHIGITSSSILLKPYTDTKTTTLTYSHYLPRIDKLILQKNKENNSAQFTISKGTPSLTPISPFTPPDSLVLGSLSIPSYTHNPSDVLFTSNENKRFTMQDIGKLEKRVDDAELFTKLSISEVEIESRSLRPVFNITTEPIKTSIFSEEFIGHSIGDVANSDYICSVDFEKGELRPFYTSYNIELTNLTLNNSGATLSPDGLITNYYTLAPYIENTTSTKTISVNPSNTINWLGFASLNREVSGVFDLSYRPFVGSNAMGENDNWTASNADNSRGFGTQWNDWSSFWCGLPSENPEQDDIQKQNLKTPHIKSTSVVPNINSGNVLAGVERTIVGIDENLSTRIRAMQLKNRIKTNVENKIVDRTVVPYIPATGFTLSVLGLKPNAADLSVYFNGDVMVSGVTSDSTGSCTVPFSIPSNTYKTGESVVRISDAATPENSTTSADVVYRCQGVLGQRDSGSYSTRPPTLRRQTVSHEKIVKDPFNRDSYGDILENSQWADPLSQTFFVDAKTNPQGIFIKKVKLYFYEKDSDLPVTVQIRPTVNGYPSPSVVIPFASVTVPATSIVANDANPAETGFQFTSPVFLEPGEYSICVLTNSGEYKLYASETGFNAVQSGSGVGGRVGGNPLVGVLFTPTSIGPAVADNGMDLMFSVDKCVFGDSGTAQYNISNTAIDSQVLNICVSELIPPGCSVKREYSNNNIFNNSENIYPFPLLSGSPTINYTLQGTPDCSPVIDSQSFFGRAVKMRCGVLGVSKYVSRVVNVDSTVSNGILAYTDMSVPSGATVSMYYRATTSGEFDIFNKSWVSLPALTPVYSAESGIDYSEAAYGITFSDQFSSYQIRLDLEGSGTPTYQKTPSVRSIKGISFVV